MNILIADSGSTKTEWTFLDAQGDTPKVSIGKGMNPYFCSANDLREEIIEHVIDAGLMPDKVFFYGAGCSSRSNIEMLQLAFSGLLPNAQIEVHHDMLAAARALCGKEEGIAVILGTGSNSCLFDGNMITHNRPALGYVMGDEGAGSRIGLELVKAYLYDELSTDISDKFESSFGIDKDEILDAVYKQEFPNRYLASFTRFVAENRTHFQLRALILNEFESFIRRHIKRYEDHQNLKVHFTGSIAFYFQDELKEVLDQHKIKMGTVLRSPMQGLINYHQQQG